MAVGRFDTAAEAQFINYYTPLPFQEMAAAGAAKQQAYDTTAQALDAAQAETEALKYISTSTDEEYIKTQVIPKVRDIAEQYSTADLGDPTTVRDIRRQLRGLDRTRIAEIQQSYDAWRQNQEMIRKLKASGQYAPYLDQSYHGYDTSESGIYNYQTPGAVDFRKEAEQYFNNLKARDLGTAVDQYGTYRRRGVASSDINKVVDEQYRSFLGTEAGRQAVQEYRYRTGDSETSSEQIIRQMLSDVGKEFTYTENQGYLPGGNGRGANNGLEGLFYNEPLRQKIAAEEYPGSKTGQLKRTAKDIERELGDKRAFLKAAIDRGDEETVSRLENVINELSNSPEYVLVQEANNKAKDRLRSISVTDLAGVLTDTESKSLLEAISEVDQNKVKSVIDTRILLKRAGVEDVTRFTDRELEKIYKKARSVNDQYKKILSEELDNIKETGIQREFTMLHMDDEGFIRIPGTNERVFSNTGNIFQSIDFDPKNFEISFIGESNRGADGRALEDFRTQKYKTIKYGQIGIEDNGDVSFTATPINEKGEDIKNYRVKIKQENRALRSAISEDFLNIGDYYTYIDVNHPYIESALNKAFKYGSRPSSIELPQFGATLLLSGDNRDEYHIKDNSTGNLAEYEDQDGNRRVYSLNREQLKRFFMKQIAINDPKIASMTGSQSIEQYRAFVNSYFSQPY